MENPILALPVITEAGSFENGRKPKLFDSALQLLEAGDVAEFRNGQAGPCQEGLFTQPVLRDV